MLDHGRYYQPTISFPVSDDNISLGQKKTHNIFETKNYNNYHNHHVEDDESSGMCSPPLWNTQQHHQQIKNNYRNLSPESKTEAIERGQRELMEMVKNMPESSYELTLKDLVEHKVHHHEVEENNNKRVIRDQRNEFSNKNGRKREGISSRNNSRNLENGGFYLKMGFPISLGSSKKHNSKKKELLAKNNSCSRVSPRSSSVSDGSVNNSKDWWKKKSCSTGNSECDHGGGSMKRYGSSSTSSSSRSNSRHETSASSCWPFLRKSDITK